MQPLLIVLLVEKFDSTQILNKTKTSYQLQPCLNCCLPFLDNQILCNIIYQVQELLPFHEIVLL